LYTAMHADVSSSSASACVRRLIRIIPAVSICTD
jgi:peptidoglycan/LPS O-acetylase OafA/YrhL